MAKSKKRVSRRLRGLAPKAVNPSMRKGRALWVENAADYIAHKEETGLERPPVKIKNAGQKALIDAYDPYELNSWLWRPAYHGRMWTWRGRPYGSWVQFHHIDLFDAREYLAYEPEKETAAWATATKDLLQAYPPKTDVTADSKLMWNWDGRHLMYIWTDGPYPSDDDWETRGWCLPETL